MTNTASVALPGGYSETTTSDNSASDTDNASADISVTITDSVTTYSTAGVTYTVTVTNSGPTTANGVSVSSTKPAQVSSWNWNCNSQLGGASGCTATSGSGNFSDSVDLPSGGSITYQVAASIVATPTGLLSTTVSVSVPSGYTDPDSSDDSATDTDALYVTIGGQGSGVKAFNDGDTVSYTLPSPVTTGHPGYDLIFYEQYIPGNNEIQLDRVTIKIGDGQNWYTIFNWGDGTADTNTSVSIPLPFTAPYTDCSGEPDNCPITSNAGSPTGTPLTNNSGIQINIDGLGIPAGTYNYVQMIFPAIGSPGDGTMGFEGFEIIP
jgi:hypothetical protein